MRVVGPFIRPMVRSARPTQRKAYMKRTRARARKSRRHAGARQGLPARGERVAPPTQRHAQLRLGRALDHDDLAHAGHALEAARQALRGAAHDAFGGTGTTFRELEWKTPIFAGGVVPKIPNASTVIFARALSVATGVLHDCKRERGEEEWHNCPLAPSSTPRRRSRAARRSAWPSPWGVKPFPCTPLFYENILRTKRSGLQGNGFAAHGHLVGSTATGSVRCAATPTGTVSS